MKLRVLSYNIHKCIGGLDRKYNPDRVVEVISHYDPDILLLQEVDNDAKRSQRHYQVEMLADKLGLPYHQWSPVVAVRGGGHHGNAILSRFPLLEGNHIDITTPPKKKRSVSYAQHHFPIPHEIEPSRRTLHLFNMHLGLSQIERKLQLSRFLESHTSDIHHSDPVIVAGDLNDLYGNLGAKIFGPAGFSTVAKPKATFPAYAPMRALDGLYLRGPIELVSLTRSDLKLAKRASDHLPLIADVHLGSSSSGLAEE